MMDSSQSALLRSHAIPYFSSRVHSMFFKPKTVMIINTSIQNMKNCSCTVPKYNVLPGQNEMTKTKNEKMFENC